MVRAVIIDDELNCRQNLQVLMEEHCEEVKVIGMAGSVSEGVKLIRNRIPDMLFLDIEIGEGSGFDVLEQIKDLDVAVIFTTAFNQYAVRAFKFSAVDYLLKPIDIEELTNAVERAVYRISQNQVNKQLEHLMHNMRATEQKPRKIGLPVQGGVQYFPLIEVIRLQSQSNYTTFYLTDQREYLISRTLKEYDELLSEQGFVRIHQSHLINVEHVVQYQKSDGGYIILSDGSNVPLSKNYKGNLLGALDKF